MRIKGGYFFKIARVELSEGQVHEQPLDEDFALTYIGGRGFNVKLVADNLTRGLDPLGPENLIVVSPGVLNGCYLPSAGKTSFSFISPATRLYGDSNMGGIFGAEIRQAGFDGLAIRGRAPKLSYLFVDDDGVHIVENEQLAGKTSLETEAAIREEIGDEEVRVASIGPAGEKLVRMACVTTDLSRNAGRCGVGTVLGSKNIKAIAVRGSKDIPVADMPRLRRLAKAGFDSLRSHHLFEFWQQQGLMSVIDYVNNIGVMPTYNFQDGVFDRADQVDGNVMEAHYKIGDANCHLCPMCCSNVCLVKDGRYAGTVVEGPEYETACMFGPNLGVANFAFIMRANHLCDQLGVDTISTGNLIGVMIEGREKGLLELEDVDGLPLAWGHEDSIIALIEKIAGREGVGDILADGATRVLEVWPQLNPIVSQVKGLEQSAYDGRVAASMALAYGTSDIGAHHARAWPLAKELELGADWTLDDKADIVIYHQTVRPLFDMLGVCRLPWIELGFDEAQYAGFFSAVTGVEESFESLLEKSRAIYDITRAINVALGASRKDDYPPDRIFDDPMLSGPQKGKHASRADYEKLLDIYYAKRGWDADGNPPITLELPAAAE
jgi:aldehyde:ferredoxin oxidoreductase